MSTQKTSALIDSCTTAFKRTGLLRLAEEPNRSERTQTTPSTVTRVGDTGRTYSVLHSDVNALMSSSMRAGTFEHAEQGGALGFQGNAAIEMVHEAGASKTGLRETAPFATPTPDDRETPQGRALGLQVLDAFLPDGGLPTGKVTELVMSGGAAWGTRLALWACLAAQTQAALTGTDSWCAYIDPSGSLHARGVAATGVTLSRLLVLRPSLEDVERVVMRLSEARVFSVIVVDLVGVPWAIRAGRSEDELRGRAEKKRQNWPRTVRQLALRLANTQAQVILLTEGEAEEGGAVNSQTRRGLPLPVALRLHLRSTRAGVLLNVVKEARGRVGGKVTVPWGVWWGNREGAETTPDGIQLGAREGRAKPLDVQLERVQSLLRTASPERQARELGIPLVASSRIARSSRASL